MRTNTKSTKTASAPITEAALSLPVPRSIHRLADQLGVEPMDLASRILIAGIRAVDDAIADDELDLEMLLLVAQVSKYEFRPEHTLTGQIEGLTASALEGCQKEADECGTSLQSVVRERLTRGANLALLSA